jgi:integrase/recombinase XerD
MSTTPLRQRTLETLTLGHYSERTIKTYIDWLARLGKHYDRSPAELDNEQVQAFLLYLIEERKLAWSTVNQALSACRFLYEKVLYRPHCELRVPARRKATYRACIYSKQQVAALLAAAQNPKHRALLMCVYGAGLAGMDRAARPSADALPQIHARMGSQLQAPVHIGRTFSDHLPFTSSIKC